MTHGDNDGCIDVRLVRDAEEHLSHGSRLEILPEVGHFLHAEKPEEVNPSCLRG